MVTVSFSSRSQGHKDFKMNKFGTSWHSNEVRHEICGSHLIKWFLLIVDPIPSRLSSPYATTVQLSFT